MAMGRERAMILLLLSSRIFKARLRRFLGIWINCMTSLASRFRMALGVAMAVRGGWAMGRAMAI